MRQRPLFGPPDPWTYSRRKCRDLLKCRLPLKQGAWGPCDAKLTRQQNERVAKRGAEDRPLRGFRAGKLRDDIGDQKGAAVDQDRDSNR